LDWQAQKIALAKDYKQASTIKQVPDALLLVDVQERFCSPAKLGNEDTEKTALHIAKMAPLFRRAGLPIYSIYTHTYKLNPGNIDFYKYEYRETDILIHKDENSAFEGTNLEICLCTNRHNNLLVMGFNTSSCVRETVIDGKERGYEIRVAADCIANNKENPRNPKSDIIDMFISRANFVSSFEILFSLTDMHPEVCGHPEKTGRKRPADKTFTNAAGLICNCPV
jgi:nicotinamidase-related amidase